MFGGKESSRNPDPAPGGYGGRFTGTIADYVSVDKTEESL